MAFAQPPSSASALRPALVNVMVRAVTRAAKGLIRDFGEIENLQVSRKGPADFVSNADMRAQAVLREELSRVRPNFGFLMEESDGAADTSNRDELWVADPLDGTTNFLHGTPHWCISIAAVRQGEVVAGVTYAPILDELYWAEKGHGAWLNNTRLRVSARRDLSTCLLSTGFPFRGSRHPVPAFLQEIGRIMPQVSGIRRCGAAALDLAYVAAGRYDGYWEHGISAWDIAGGIILVREAGGVTLPLQSTDSSSRSSKKQPANDLELITSGGILACNVDLGTPLRSLIVHT